MEKFVISVAGFNILIHFDIIYTHPQIKNKLKASIKKYLHPFIIKKNAFPVDSTIHIQDKDLYKIIFNKNQSYAELGLDSGNNIISTQYQISFTQFLIILSGIVTNLLKKNDGLLIHGSSCLVKDKAHLFVGKEGIGKSTILRMLSKKYTALVDDQIFIKRDRLGFKLYQNPYIEKEYWIKKSYKSYSVGNIYFLKQAKSFKITPLTSRDSLSKLMQNLLLTSEAKKQYISTLFKFHATGLNCFELSFNLLPDELFNYFKNSS